MKNNEQLLERIHQLEMKNKALEQAGAFNTLILNGLEAILASSNTDELFKDFFSILQRTISFSAAILVKYNPNTESYSMLKASKENAEKVLPELIAILSIQPNIKNIFELRKLTKWQIDALFWQQQHSLLTAPVTTNKKQYQLFVFSEKQGAFNQKDVSLLQQFISFTGNTISQFEQKSLQQRQQNIEQTLINSEKMASLGQMAAGVAHEINNPLSYVISNIQNLAHNIQQHTNLIKDLVKPQFQSTRAINERLEHYQFDELTQDTSDILSEMKEGANRVKEIVQSLKLFAHPNQTKIDDINLTSLLENTLRVAWNQIKYNATIERYYCADEIKLIGRTTQLYQVFLNIFINAAQSLSNSVGMIAVTTTQDSYNAYITISDNGCGIPADKLNSIFDPFFTTKPIGKGTGLGLAISRAIIEQHNGKISVQSKPGEGTVFSITLPKNSDLNDEELTIIALKEKNDD